MTINFEQEYEMDFEFDPEAVADAVINGALDEAGCIYESEVNITLVDEETIQNINREYRNIDKITDVLSFPLISYSHPEQLDEEDLICQDAFNPDSGELMLGDIVICVPRMLEQAIEYGHSAQREYAFLIAHSMMHLFGHDHMEAEEAAVMEEKQERILQKLGITR